jgi:prevent-host-death family protein
MTKMGYYKVRTHLSALLDEVARGKEILITRHGRPAALLSPPPRVDGRDVRQVVREMLELRDREGPTLGSKIALRDLINEGRRF